MQNLDEDGAAKRHPALGLLVKGLSRMTVREQQAVLVVLLLGLLGLGVKLWHLRHGGDAGAGAAREETAKYIDRTKSR